MLCIDEQMYTMVIQSICRVTLDQGGKSETLRVRTSMYFHRIPTVLPNVLGVHEVLLFSRQ